jgi:DNA-binding HxlR family transcriptional regulator
MRGANIDRHHQPAVEGDDIAFQGIEDGFYEREEEDKLLTISRDAYVSGKHWFDSSVREQLERNLQAFNNRHPKGSKYYTEQYRKKSKIFRPKTRSTIRKKAAAAAVAFFSSSDVLHCSPLNDSDERQRLAAELHMALAQFRLERPEMHWFMTLIGALTDAATNGAVISRQDWRLAHRDRMIRETYQDRFGFEHQQTVREQEIIEDRPQITLLPIENMLFDPACDWRDPIRTSPYLIELVPMYVKDVRELQRKTNPMTGKPYYRPTPSGMVAAAIQQDWDSVRKAREGDRLDRYDNDTVVTEHQTVWIHKHIMSFEGHDYCWDTLGTEFVLSAEIQPIEDVYLTGNRPYVMGFCNVEPHKQYPAGDPELIEGLQEETNDIANLRLDNVKLALNKRYYAKRGAGIDVRSLVRNVAGSVTFMNNPDTDVKTVETRDVTTSSYEEQNRLNLDIDDLIGDFSAGTVQANRQMNETVGGMKMLENNVSPLREMTIRTFAETWVEPVLRQLIELEAVYETDQTLLLTAGAQIGMENVQQALDVIAEPIKVKVNVGFDATDPMRRVQKLAFGFGTIASYFPQLMQKADPGEAVKEIMGALGYKDGVRFFPQLHRDQPPIREQQLEERIQQLEQFIQTEQYKTQGKLQEIQVKEEYATARETMKMEAQWMMQQVKGNLEAAIVRMKNRLEEIDRMIDVELSRIKRQELFLQREALSHEIQEANRRYELEKQGQSLPEGGAPDLAGNDMAGTITRDRYGMIPGMGG